MQDYTKVPGAKLYLTIVFASFAMAAIVGQLGLPGVCRRGEKLFSRISKFKHKVQKMKKESTLSR